MHTKDAIPTDRRQECQHRVSRRRRLERGRAVFGASCSCGASVDRLTTSGMVAGWQDDHQRPAERRLPPFFDAPERGTYEAAIVAVNPRLGSLLAGGPVDLRGGAR